NRHRFRIGARDYRQRRPLDFRLHQRSRLVAVAGRRRAGGYRRLFARAEGSRAEVEGRCRHGCSGGRVAVGLVRVSWTRGSTCFGGSEVARATFERVPAMNLSVLSKPDWQNSIGENRFRKLEASVSRLAKLEVFASALTLLVVPSTCC